MQLKKNYLKILKIERVIRVWTFYFLFSFEYTSFTLYTAPHNNIHRMFFLKFYVNFFSTRNNKREKLSL
jgi:hypothetical protein